MSDRALDPNWDTFIYVAAEGFRIALISCLRCGATVTLSEGPPDTSEIHNR